MEVTNAIIFAGKTMRTDIADLAPGCFKSLIEINGRPAISYMAEILAGCDCISKVIVVGGEQVAGAIPETCAFIESTGSEAEDIMAAVHAADGEEKCLIITGDMPLITSNAINDLLTCAPSADVVYPVIGKPDMSEAYPEREPYYVKTKEGQFTGSGALLFRREAALSKQNLITSLMNARRNPMELMSLVGAGFAMKFMMTTLSLTDFQAQLSTVSGLDIRVFISHYPELFVSIDSREDVKIIERELHN